VPGPVLAGASGSCAGGSPPIHQAPPSPILGPSLMEEQQRTIGAIRIMNPLTGVGCGMAIFISSLADIRLRIKRSRVKCLDLSNQSRFLAAAMRR
jgi:hypothetical protein